MDTTVTPVSTAELMEQMQGRIYSAPPIGTDPEDLGYIPDVAGVEIVVPDCANATSYVTTNVSLGTNVDGQETSLGLERTGVGGVEYAASGGTSNDNTTPPSISSSVKRPAVAKGAYGKPIPGHSDSSFGANFWVYDTVDRDVRGRTLVYWQNADISAGPSVNFYSAIGRSYSPGRVHFEGSVPFATRDYDQTTFDAKLEFSVEKKDQASAGVSVSRTFTVSKTKFGGHRYRTNSGFTFEVDGGYLSINRGHRNNSRQWSQGAAWVFPYGTSNRTQISLLVEWKRR